ncbi:Zn(2+)-responsive transcriptional regulator [Pseudoalteromonas xiamenensis]|uniref:Zn(2+)-responsive transcriptional regulator n=1 Tax=Pseudoalteromonas xiamenensis TaxID=882626 RepID=UPI0027E3CA73|nr:Zn(2+)-responsive transcriptional regulator [Pseudoalteromonas xiamenensis]WMN59165.1 Zn(2+)-responsive transcriptional regulator [Pseudoalteromonas xiamenensis]
MKIGELAKRLNISTDTLRYYENNGLISASARTGAGYRDYSDVQEHQLRFVLRAKAVGFSLSEIKELLKIRIDKQQYQCDEVKSITLAKLTLVQERIRELQCFERSLTVLAERCCGGAVPAEHCSILTTLEELDGHHS